MKMKKKGTKDPNKPKRPSTAFFIFMSEFRKTHKKENPKNRSVAAVSKAAGEKWKQMSDDDKAPYIAEANRLKIVYEMNMEAYASTAPKEDEENPADSDSAVSDDCSSATDSGSEVSDDSNSDDGKEKEKRRKTSNGNAPTSSIAKVAGPPKMVSTPNIFTHSEKKLSPKKGLAGKACDASAPVKKSPTLRPSPSATTPCQASEKRVVPPRPPCSEKKRKSPPPPPPTTVSTTKKAWVSYDNVQNTSPTEETQLAEKFAPSPPGYKQRLENDLPEQLCKSAMQDLKAAGDKLAIVNSHASKQEAQMKKIQGDIQKYKDATIKEYLASEEHKMVLANHLQKSRLDIVKDYLTSNEHKNSLVDHIERYKKSEDHQKALIEHLEKYKTSEEYKKELADSLENYKCSEEFKKALADHLEECKESEEYQKEYKNILRKLCDLSSNAQHLLNARSMTSFLYIDLTNDRVKIEDPTGVPPPSFPGSSKP